MATRSLITKRDAHSTTVAIEKGCNTDTKACAVLSCINHRLRTSAEPTVETHCKS